MRGYFFYPPKAKFAKVIPKIKIYANLQVKRSAQDLFAKQVEKIIWQYKLSPTTTNIAPSEDIKEIQILNLFAKEKDISELVFKTIDQSIPSPIIFQIFYQDMIMIKATYKRQSLKDKSKHIISKYLQTEYFSKNEEKKPLPLSLDLSKLYTYLLNDLMPINLKEQNLEKKLEILDKIQSLKTKCKNLEQKMISEKQFNKKLKLNQILKELKQEIKRIECETKDAN